MNKAEKQAKIDIKKEFPAFYPDSNSFDQWNFTITHLFTTENRKLNKLILKNLKTWKT